MFIFRIEIPDSEQGLWYTKQRVYQPVVHQYQLKCAELPMEYDPETYQADGLDWYSGCDSLEDLTKWFSKEEMKTLVKAGFKINVYRTDIVRQHYGHVLFAKEHVKASKILDLGTVFD